MKLPYDNPLDKPIDKPIDKPMDNAMFYVIVEATYNTNVKLFLEKKIKFYVYHLRLNNFFKLNSIQLLMDF